jgi:hypothetical protein
MSESAVTRPPSEVLLPRPTSPTEPVVGPARERGGLDRLIPLLATLALLVPLGVSLASLSTQTSANLTFTDRERDGVTYLRPLVRLVSATVDAQSAAVAGKAPDVMRLKAAAHDVDTADAQLGSILGTTDRWGDLRTQLDQLGTTGGTPLASYRTYSDAVALELALVSRVGDTSNLILDPELDAYYVMDATLLRIPAIVTDGGRVAALTGLAEASHSDAARLSAAVSTSTVRSSMTDIDDGLRKSFNATSSRTLAAGLLTPLDRLRDAITTFAPPTLDVGAATRTQDRAESEQNRTAVRDAALAFESSGLTELDALLAARRDAQSTTQRWVLGIVVAGLLLAAGLTGWGVARRRSRRGDTAADPRVDLSFVDAAPSDLVGAGRSGVQAQGRP